MALDVGEARIGVAVSDATRFLASPYMTLHVGRDEEQTWAAIRRCIEETEATGVVVGLPISLDGQIHAQGERVQAFAERLRGQVAIPVLFWDERLSTVEAQRLYMEGRLEQGKGQRGGRQGRQGREQGHKSKAKRRRQKGHEIDALAATVILQEYLDAQGKTTGETRP